METQVSALAGAEVENNVLSSLFRVEGESFPVGLRGGGPEGTEKSGRGQW